MNINSAVSRLLTNQWVLRIVAFLALFNIIGYVTIGNINAVVYFILFAVLVRFFSKNMTIVLGAPLLLVNLLAIRGNMLEGFDGETQEDEKEDQTEKEKAVNILDLPTDENKTTTTINNSAAAVTVNAVAEDNPAQSKDGFETGRRKSRGNDIGSAANIEDAYQPARF